MRKSQYNFRVILQTEGMVKMDERIHGREWALEKDVGGDGTASMRFDTSPT